MEPAPGPRAPLEPHPHKVMAVVDRMSREEEITRINSKNSITPSDLTRRPEQKDDPLCPRLAFVERPRFQIACGLAIAMNVLVLAGETDFPEWQGWSVFEHAFMALFTVEIALRVAYVGTGFFTGKDRWWAALDTSLMGLGVFDLWVTRFLLGWSARSHYNLLRLLRILRLLRLLRIFKMFPKLLVFLSALAAMMGTFVWIFAVLFLFLLVCAILLTHLLGHGDLWRDDEAAQLLAEEQAAARKAFRNVPTSLLSLFQVITQDDWNEIARPIIKLSPQMQLFFVIFIAFASWTMISVLTGVASDEMLVATSTRKEAERAEQEQRHKDFMEFLRASFYDADADGNGLLDKEEFEGLMKQPSMLEHMQTLGVQMTVEEMSRAWVLLDAEGHGELTIDDFVEGLSYLQETLSVKHILNIDYSVKRTAWRLEMLMERLLDELDEVAQQSIAIAGLLEEGEELEQQLGAELQVWREWAAANSPHAVSTRMVVAARKALGGAGRASACSASPEKLVRLSVPEPLAA